MELNIQKIIDETKGLEDNIINRSLIIAYITLSKELEKIKKESDKNHNALKHARIDQEELYKLNSELRENIKYAVDNLITMIEILEKDMNDVDETITMTSEFFKAYIKNPIKDLQKIVDYLKSQLPITLDEDNGK